MSLLQIFGVVFSTNSHQRGVKFYHTLYFGMPYGGIHFSMNLMATSFLSMHLFVEHIQKFSLQF
jgi:hypothetical protein